MEAAAHKLRVQKKLKTMITSNKIFKASLGTASKVITLIITLLFIGILISNFIWFEETNSAIFLIPVFIGIYAVCIFFMPLGYKITESEIVVERMLSSVRFKTDDVKSIQEIGKHTIAGSVRTFGNGGLFGFTGYFANSALGKMTWFVTRKDTLVLIDLLDGKKILISPNEPKEFMNAFKN